MANSIEQSVIDIVADVLGDAPESIKADMTFAQLGADEMDIASIFVEIEDGLDVLIDFETDFDTVRDVITYVERALA